MPAFVTHFLIAKAVLSSSGLPNPDQNERYFILGSVGPDLPYYRNVFGTAVGTFFEEKFNPDSPGYYTGYGDFFHGRTPNVFPMKMLETIRKDKDPGTKDQKLAFALGYLTHVAADQHIHPEVESYAGPYYVSATNREKHRTFEVYEDILLYEGLNPEKKFFDEDFRSWFDVSAWETVQIPAPHGGPNTEQRLVSNAPEWLSSFVQRSFLEAYGVILDNGEFEKWIKGFSSIFSALKSIGPYHDAQNSIEKGSADAKNFEGIFDDPNYVEKWFKPAVKLASDYLTAAAAFMKATPITDQERNLFLHAVSDADLTSPLVVM